MLMEPIDVDGINNWGLMESIDVDWINGWVLIESIDVDGINSWGLMESIDVDGINRCWWNQSMLMGLGLGFFCVGCNCQYWLKGRIGYIRSTIFIELWGKAKVANDGTCCCCSGI
jgi:hypothetical protein